MSCSDENTHLENDVRTLCNRAQRLQREEKYDEAAEKFALALEVDPHNAIALVGLGDLELKRHQFKEAAYCYQKCLTVDIDTEPALVGLGDAYRFLEGKRNGF